LALTGVSGLLEARGGIFVRLASTKSTFEKNYLRGRKLLADLELTQIGTRGVIVYEGEGPSVLLLHGCPQVHALDLRGYGDGPKLLGDAR
jgi:hypothetical protein